MYFQPPRELEATPFARLPEQWRDIAADNEWIVGQGAPHAHNLLEGPSFDRDGNLWCVDIPSGRIFRVDPRGNFTLMAEYDGWPNGLKIARDGRIFVADYKNGIMVLDPDTGRPRPWIVRAHLERFKAVNDLYLAANGDLYFTDQGMTGLHDPTGRLFRVSAAGRVECLLENVPSPNGVVMNVAENVVYVAATRANSIWRVPLLSNGEVAGKVANFIQLSGGGGPDGLAVDAQDRLVIAHVGLGSVWVFDALGEPVYRIRSKAGLLTTNVAFGGPDNRTLYITEALSASILRCELDVPGKTMESHR